MRSLFIFTLLFTSFAMANTEKINVVGKSKRFVKKLVSTNTDYGEAWSAQIKYDNYRVKFEADVVLGDENILFGQGTITASYVTSGLVCKYPVDLRAKYVSESEVELGMYLPVYLVVERGDATSRSCPDLDDYYKWKGESYLTKK